MASRLDGNAFEVKRLRRRRGEAVGVSNDTCLLAR